MLTICFFSAGHEGRVVAANVGTVADIETQFGVLMSIYGIVHNIFYLALAWAQDRFSPRILIPVNMVLGGITTFFLGQTNDFATLCFLFVMLSLWCEGAFWPAILSSVRKSTSDSNQGKIFGLLEGGRGGIELLQNASPSAYTPG